MSHLTNKQHDPALPVEDLEVSECRIHYIDMPIAINSNPFWPCHVPHFVTGLSEHPKKITTGRKHLYPEITKIDNIQIASSIHSQINGEVELLWPGTPFTERILEFTIQVINQDPVSSPVRHIDALPGFV